MFCWLRGSSRRMSLTELLELFKVVGAYVQYCNIFLGVSRKDVKFSSDETFFLSRKALAEEPCGIFHQTVISKQSGTGEIVTNPKVIQDTVLAGISLGDQNKRDRDRDHDMIIIYGEGSASPFCLDRAVRREGLNWNRRDVSSGKIHACWKMLREYNVT